MLIPIITSPVLVSDIPETRGHAVLVSDIPETRGHPVLVSDIDTRGISVTTAHVSFIPGATQYSRDYAVILTGDYTVMYVSQGDKGQRSLLCTGCTMREQ